MRIVPLTLVSLFVGAAVWACGGDDGPGSSGTGGSGGETGDGDGDSDTTPGDGDAGDGDGDGTGGGDGDGDGDGTGGGTGGGGGNECVGDVTRCTDDPSEVDVCVEGSWETQECSSSIPLCEDGSCDPENCDGCLIDEQCYPDGASNPENSCQVCDAPESDWSNVADGTSCGDNGSCDAGACACTDGWTGSDCTTCVAYVKTDGDDEESGLSWDGALADVNVALELAASRRIDEEVDSCQVWVAEGTYKPGTELTSTFQLQEQVELYGGFAGNETLLSQRDWEEHETILSGDLAGDDAAGDLDTPVNPPHRTDNVYHLVTVTDAGLLDGLVIQGGGNGTVLSSETEKATGGGLLVVSAAAVEMRNCLLRDNYSRLEGAALYASDSELLVQDTHFIGNMARLGTTIRLEESDVSLEGGDVSENRGSGNPGGGAISSIVSSLSVSQVSFLGNHGVNTGSALYIDGNGEVSMRRCLFDSNISVGNGGAVSIGGGNSQVVDTTFSNNRAENTSGAVVRGGALDAVKGNVWIVNSTFKNNSAQGNPTSYGGAIVNWGTSKMWISNSLFVGNDATLGSAIRNEGEDATLQVVNCSLFGNSPSGTNGTLSNFEGGVQVFNSIFWGGSTPEVVHVDAPTTETSVAFSDVAGGYTGEGNLDLDPEFVDAPAGDLHLNDDSPLLNQGDSASLPEDVLDLDDDGTLTEPLPVDLDGNDRVVGSSVDLGAYERP